MALVPKQSRFLAKWARLILEAQRRGYLTTGGELLRPQITADWYASQGKGIKDSLHKVSLAGDLLLHTSAGEYLTDTEAYRPLGEWWEAQSEPDLKLCWGGRWGDGNHFSAEHLGVR